MYRLTILFRKDEKIDIKEELKEIEEILTKEEAKKINFSEPKEITLLSSIKDEISALIVLINFEAPSGAVKDINKKLKGRGEILRFIIEKAPKTKKIKQPVEKEPSAKEILKTQIKERKKTEKVLEGMDEEKERLEVLDSELDKILEE